MTILNLGENKLSSNEWYNLGDDYYKAKNYSQAFYCYEQALKLNPKHFSSLYSLGWMYEYGQSVAIKFSVAAKYYRQAIENGYADAQKDLNRLFDRETISGDELNSVGVMYHSGDGVIKDYEKALI
jgi:TPR repeat protein